MAAGDITEGRRLPDVEVGKLPDGGEYPYRGAYWRDAAGTWWCGIPAAGGIGNLSRHEVVEHEDGTITVSPSILVSDNAGPIWHGYLEHGRWREV